MPKCQQHLPKSGDSVIKQALCFYQSFCQIYRDVLRNRNRRVAEGRQPLFLNLKLII
mgnify:CR=1 FL=1